MARKKWGESFLKSGFPLEHVTLVTFRSSGFDCYPNVEFSRQNERGQEAWFELDLCAISHRNNKDTDLSFLVECKYHDLSRFWFFLTGELWGFNPESWSDPGHVHPITPTEMRGLLRENGFECREVMAGGNLPVIWAYNWKRLLVSLLVLPLRLMMRGEKDGWVLCYHARRAS